MNDLTMWSLIVGFFSPIILAVIQQPKFRQSARAIIMFLYCLVVSGVTVFMEGSLTGQRFVTSALIVMVTAISTYKGLWQPTGFAPAIERSTSPSQSE